MTFRQRLGAGLGMIVGLAIATAGAGTAGAAPWGSTGVPDVGIERAQGEGLNACAVRVTNRGDHVARDVTVHVQPGLWPYTFGTLEPGESSVATAFDCGFTPILLHVVTTSNGDGNWTDNVLYFEL
ncbi:MULTISPECIES: hypothetical protein [Mycobacteriales]|uniref:CARDB domain-containing protein n=1 Tax=Gordonia rubripertincta TaxID=36822 RepID=A0ABT4MU77_GORRU|nr:MULTISPECIES: hypothetical protein [Mycobacteriales]MCZ4549596.1 hypothetical protein [Gordonia rubripertincta]